ncbi:MAG: dipeptidase [Aggregatilineales bacterium]
MTSTQKIPVFDGHNDTVLRYDREDGYDFFKRNATGHIDLPRAKASSFAGGFFACFIPSPLPTGKMPRPKLSDFKQKDGSYLMPFPPEISQEYGLNMAVTLMAHLFRMEKQSNDDFEIVRTADELEASIPKDNVTAIVHIEGAEPIDTQFYALEVLYQAGLRSLGMVWSRPTAFGYGVPFAYPSTGDTGKGLTPAGFELVNACNDLGIMLDLSHLNEKGFWDVAKTTSAPLVATHSNVYELCKLSRNLTDKQFDAVKESNGVVGLNFGVSFIDATGPEAQDATVADMVKHITYMVERMGIDHVALGSDFDGTGVSSEIKDVTGVDVLIEALRDAGYDDDSLRKIAYQNWVRVLRDTWKD